MPAATHLTASMLSSAHPGTTFGRTRVHTLPYGRQDQEKRQSIALGALDLIEDDATPSLFGTGVRVAHGTGADLGERGEPGYDPPPETADLVIMNPPFTRPTNHEKAEVPVPSFAGLGRTEDEQQAMAKRLDRSAQAVGRIRRVTVTRGSPQTLLISLMGRPDGVGGPCACASGLVCERRRLGRCAPSIGS